MKGLDPDERWALSRAPGVDIDDELTSKMLARGLIVLISRNATDEHYRITAEGHLALKLDTLARGTVGA